MSEHHSENEHIGIPGYLGVFAVLIVGTVLTYYAATVDMDYIFPGANTLVALLIAFTKMTCVMLFFMHVRWSPRMIWLAAAMIAVTGDEPTGWICLLRSMGGLYSIRYYSKPYDDRVHYTF